MYSIQCVKFYDKKGVFWILGTAEGSTCVECSSVILADLVSILPPWCCQEVDLLAISTPLPTGSQWDTDNGKCWTKGRECKNTKDRYLSPNSSLRGTAGCATDHISCELVPSRVTTTTSRPVRTRSNYDSQMLLVLCSCTISCGFPVTYLHFCK